MTAALRHLLLSFLNDPFDEFGGQLESLDIVISYLVASLKIPLLEDVPRATGQYETDFQVLDSMVRSQ